MLVHWNEHFLGERSSSLLRTNIAQVLRGPHLIVAGRKGLSEKGISSHLSQPPSFYYPQRSRFWGGLSMQRKQKYVKVCPAMRLSNRMTRKRLTLRCFIYYKRSKEKCGVVDMTRAKLLRMSRMKRWWTIYMHRRCCSQWGAALLFGGREWTCSERNRITSDLLTNAHLGDRLDDIEAQFLALLTTNEAWSRHACWMTF